MVLNYDVLFSWGNPVFQSYLTPHSVPLQNKKVTLETKPKSDPDTQISAISNTLLKLFELFTHIYLQ